MIRKELEDLLKKVSQIQGLMIYAATGEGDPDKKIAEKDTEYKALYADLKERFQNLRQQGLDLPDRNGFASLREFQGYWRLKSLGWAGRREYVNSLYSDLEQSVSAILSGAQVSTSEADTLTVTTGQPPLFIFTFDMLHPEIARRCQHLFQTTNYDEAILNAFKVIEERVRQATKLRPDDVGVTLMKEAFNPNAPKLVYSSVTAEQEGAMALFRGGIACFKNPHSHRFVDITDPIQTFEILCFASTLCRIVDGIERK